MKQELLSITEKEHIIKSLKSFDDYIAKFRRYGVKIDLNIVYEHYNTIYTFWTNYKDIIITYIKHLWNISGEIELLSHSEKGYLYFYVMRVKK